jgi:hypothetical protein
MLGLGSNITKAGKIGKPIVKDGLVLKHGYAGGPVEPCSTGAASFNGTSDYIDINAKPVDTADATYCFWLNSTDAGYAPAFSHSGGASTEGQKTGTFDTNYTSSGKPIIYLNDSSYQYWVDTGFADDGKWHHWAVVVDILDARNSILYIDGVIIAKDGSGSDGDSANSYGNLRIGMYDSDEIANKFIGPAYMCNFGVWSGHLTQPQVKSIMHKDYAALSASEKTSLVSWWNLDEETATNGTAGTGGVKDYHGSNHGTLS